MWDISHEIVLILVSLDPTDDKSTLVQVMAWSYTEALKGHRVVWKIEIYYLIRMT